MRPTDRGKEAHRPPEGQRPPEGHARRGQRQEGSASPRANTGPFLVERPGPTGFTLVQTSSRSGFRPHPNPERAKFNRQVYRTTTAPLSQLRRAASNDQGPDSQRAETLLMREGKYDDAWWQKKAWRPGKTAGGSLGAGVGEEYAPAQTRKQVEPVDLRPRHAGQALRRSSGCGCRFMSTGGRKSLNHRGHRGHR
jgi:hypothetical protein